MIFTKKVTSLRVLSAAAGAAVLGMAAPIAAQADITGNISVVSKYVLRGITNTNSFGTEADFGAVQGGFDYAHPSGFYVGYWGSSLSYSEGAAAPATKQQTTGFENDLYAGYKLKAGPVELNFGAIQYLYTGIGHFDGLEAVFSAAVGPVTAGLKYLTNDVGWGNKGDIYWTVAYSQPLPQGFKFDGLFGYYSYDKTGKFVPVTSAAGAAQDSSAFRHVDLKLSHPLGKSGFDMSLTYVIGGWDRYRLNQPNALVLGLSSSF